MSISHSNGKVFFIDSANRISGSSDTNFSVQIDGIPPDSKYNRVALMQCSIPKSFYNFESGSNTFTLIEKGVNYTITIPVGFYNKNNLITTLGSLLTLTSGNGWTYTCSYPDSSSANTGLITFRVTGNGSFQPSFSFGTSCWLQLGFNSATTYPFVGSVLTSVNFISLSPINRVFIKSNICSTSYNSVLQEILQVFPDSSFIYYQQTDVDSNSKEFTGSKSNVFNFVITDRFGNVINTHGLNVMLSVFLYEKNNTDELMKEDLLIKSLQRLYDLESAVGVEQKNLLKK